MAIVIARKTCEQNQHLKYNQDTIGAPPAVEEMRTYNVPEV